MSQEQFNKAQDSNPYTLPVTLLIIGLLFAGSGAVLVENAVIQLGIGLAALVLILAAVVLGIRRMQRDPDLSE